MKFSNLFSKTLRDDQKDADVASHNLLLRAGYIRQVAAGIFSYLHFGQKAIRKIEQIIREEMNRIGGDEICMPIVHPAEVWQKTNRWQDIDASMVRFKDRNERDMVLAMTHEEIVALHCSTEIDTYKQLPKLVYQIQTKFRDEQRSRGGLIRVREFTMKDSYSLDKDMAGLEQQYIHHYDAYFRIFARIGLPAMAILSDTGMMGGNVAHEYMYITPIGEDTIFTCDSSGYRANREIATIRKIYNEQEPLPLEKIHTPNKKTIAELVDFFKLTEDHFAKMVFFSGIVEDQPKVIVAVVRGDMEANPIKIQKLTKAKNLIPASEKEISEIGAVAGFASPIDLDRSKCIVIVDDLISQVNNYIVGANEIDYHIKNACHGRDYTADIIGDLVFAFEGGLCPISDSEDNILKSTRGVEIGNIFQLGTKYTEALDANFMDSNGRPTPIVMGSYGIGVGRLLACLCEEYNDDLGLKLPFSVVPYHVILVAILDDEEIKKTAEQLYQDLLNQNIEVIYDDRNKKSASPGVKFKDAELIGIPLRLTLSKKSILKGGVELKYRDSEQIELLSLEEAGPRIKSIVDNGLEEIASNLESVETWKE